MNLFHRLSWRTFRDEALEQGDINSEFEYGLKRFNLYSNLYYSMDEKRIHSLTNRVGYNQNNYDIMLTHFYNYDLVGNKKETNFINASLNHNYDSHNQWFLEYDYDLEQSFNHQWSLGWEHREKCWGAKVSIGQEEIPNVDSSFINNMLYFELNLNPFGGISQNIEQEFSTEGR
jgi:lipopolysaccharide assembly outer membrane protein LptD (OstA)